MIHIEKDGKIYGNENLKVATATGDYEDSALIEFYDVSNTSLVAGAFQAQYIKYGNLVYGFNDPVDLGKAILEIDPESTHTAASYVRMTNELLSQMNSGSLEAKSLDEVISTEQENMEENRMEENNVQVENKVQDTVSPEVTESTNEPEVIPEVVVPNEESEVLGDTSSTTPESMIEGVEEVVGTPEELIPEVVVPDIISDPATTTEILKESSLRKTRVNKVLAEAKKVIRKRKV